MSMARSSIILIFIAFFSITKLPIQKLKDRLIFFYSVKDPYHKELLEQFMRLKPKLARKSVSSVTLETMNIETENLLSQKFNIFKSRTIILVKHNGKFMEYEGNLEIEEVSKFIISLKKGF
jgi:hypothetical protein